MNGRRARERRRKDAGTVLFILPEIEDGLDTKTKNALAIRNQCSIEGRCPSCGATPTMHADPDYPRLSHIVFMHEDWCDCLRDEEAA